MWPISNHMCAVCNVNVLKHNNILFFSTLNLANARNTSRQIHIYTYTSEWWHGIIWKGHNFILWMVRYMYYQDVVFCDFSNKRWRKSLYLNRLYISMHVCEKKKTNLYLRIIKDIVFIKNKKKNPKDFQELYKFTFPYIELEERVYLFILLKASLLSWFDKDVKK